MGLTFAIYAKASFVDVEEAKPQGTLSQQFVEATYSPIITRNDLCSCVIFARAYSGKQVFGNAETLIPTKFSNPQIGDWILFPNHAAVIVGIQNQTLNIIEANFYKCEISRRNINVKDKNIRGYL